MPNVIKIFRKTDSENEPVSFIEIDNELCGAFGAEVHPNNFFCGWYDAVGYSAKDNFADIINSHRERIGSDTNAPIGMVKHREKVVKVLEYLDQNFTLSAYYSPR